MSMEQLQVELKQRYEELCNRRYFDSGEDRERHDGKLDMLEEILDLIEFELANQPKTE